MPGDLNVRGLDGTTPRAEGAGRGFSEVRRSGSARRTVGVPEGFVDENGDIRPRIGLEGLVSSDCGVEGTVAATDSVAGGGAMGRRLQGGGGGGGRARGWGLSTLDSTKMGGESFEFENSRVRRAPIQPAKTGGRMNTVRHVTPENLRLPLVEFRQRPPGVERPARDQRAERRAIERGLGARRSMYSVGERAGVDQAVARIGQHRNFDDQPAARAVDDPSPGCFG